MQKFLVVLLVLLAGCVSEHSFVQEEAYFNQSDETLIAEAKNALAQKDYRGAVKILESFGTLYPLSPKSLLAEKLLIEIYYRQAEYPMLKAASDRFIYEHPQDKIVDYVKYLRFVAGIKQAKGYPYDWISYDYATRDVSRFKDSFLEGKSFITDHPNSQYAPEVAHQLPFLKNTIARYYWLRGEDLYARKQYIGAIQSYQVILDDFSDTPYESLARNKIESFDDHFKKIKSINLK